MTMRILSMGAGVQTTAMAIRWIEEYDHIVFADTGDEKPETYAYIHDYLKPFCGKKWQAVKWRYVERLMDHAIRMGMMPTRMNRWCTRETKIEPIKRFMRARGAHRRAPWVMDLGISWDESHRMNSSIYDVQYVRKSYPLIDARITRDGCRQIIRGHGWPVPEKSGCVGCPFAGKAPMRLLARQDPAAYERLLRMEEGAKNFPEKTLFDGITLRRLRERALAAGSLDGFMPEPEPQECETGHCFA